jgi:broad-specificity NMP kinase
MGSIMTDTQNRAWETERIHENITTEKMSHFGQEVKGEGEGWVGK